MYRLLSVICLIAGLAGLLAAPSAVATDGDVSYSAPYIWVNPETGEISTINPGPQPKVHTAIPEDNMTTQGPPQTGTDPAVQSTSTGGTDPAEPAGQVPVIAIVAGIAVLLGGAGFFLRKSGKAG